MTDKEKAKRYDEAIERARKLKEDPQGVFYEYSPKEGDTICDYIFPELNEESEDEKIRKELICFLNTEIPQCEARDKYTSWLEKQGEQTSLQTNERAWLYLVSDVLTWKDGIGQYLDNPRVQELAKKLCSEYAQKLYNPSVLSNSSNTGKNEKNHADKVEPKFNVREWIVNNKHKDVFFISNINSRYYTLEDTKGIICQPSLSLTENDYHLWTIADAKDGDILATDDDNICIFDGTVKDSKYPFAYCGLTRHRFEFYDRRLPFTHDNIHPATKEQRDLLFEKMKEAGYEWNIEKKKLEIVDWSKHIKYEPNTPSIIKENPVWSEEDETYLDYIITAVKLCYPDDKSKENHWRNELLNWLKSLKGRVQPKQEWSEEDKRILDALITSLINERFAGRLKFLKGIRVSLVIDWLKSLKEKIGG